MQVRDTLELTIIAAAAVILIGNIAVLLEYLL